MGLDENPSGGQHDSPHDNYSKIGFRECAYFDSPSLGILFTAVILLHQ
jgi:hypothetical protein